MRAASPLKMRNGLVTRETVPVEVESEEVLAAIMHGSGDTVLEQGDQVGNRVVQGTGDVLLEREVQLEPLGSIVQEACVAEGCDAVALTKRPTTSTLHGNVVCMGYGSSSGPSHTVEGSPVVIEGKSVETPIFVFGATPECPVAVVGDASTVGKVDIAE
ncbi:hypothetical protein ACOSP7_019669 [Xanthoceras sorbifolium]